MEKSLREEAQLTAQKVKQINDMESRLKILEDDNKTLESKLEAIASKMESMDGENQQETKVENTKYHWIDCDVCHNWYERTSINLEVKEPTDDKKEKYICRLCCIEDTIRNLPEKLSSHYLMNKASGKCHDKEKRRILTGGRNGECAETEGAI